MKLSRAVALRISKLMLEKEIPSQYAVARDAGLTESTLRNIINESYKGVNLSTIIKICDGLKITVQEFFDDELFSRKNLDLE